MFFQKLWVRMKGELLSLRDDLSASEGIRQKAETLLERVEKQLEGEGMTSGPNNRTETAERGNSESDSSISKGEVFGSIEQEWADLNREAKGKNEQAEENRSEGPNPRKLG